MHWDRAAALRDDVLPWTTLAWAGPGQLEARYDARGLVDRRATSRAGVRVRYTGLDGAAGLPVVASVGPVRWVTP
jgi:hypothetical protein